MRRLTLLRHAHAEAMDFDLIPTDDVRPLSAAGAKAARAMAERLAAATPTPPRIITSPARRTRDTAAEVAMAYGMQAAEIFIENDIYDAAVSTLLTLIQHQPDSAAHVLLCGHNPGISGLARYLAANPPPPPLAPCGLVTLCCELPNWHALARGCGRVERLWQR